MIMHAVDMGVREEELKIQTCTSTNDVSCSPLDNRRLWIKLSSCKVKIVQQRNVMAKYYCGSQSKTKAVPQREYCIS